MDLVAGVKYRAKGRTGFVKIRKIKGDRVSWWGKYGVCEVALSVLPLYIEFDANGPVPYVTTPRAKNIPASVYVAVEKELPTVRSLNMMFGVVGQQTLVVYRREWILFSGLEIGRLLVSMEADMGSGFTKSKTRRIGLTRFARELWLASSFCETALKYFDSPPPATAPADVRQLFAALTLGLELSKRLLPVLSPVTEQ